MGYNRAGRKRLSCDIPDEIYLKILMSSGKKKCTVTKWVIRALVAELKKEELFNKDVK